MRVDLEIPTEVLAWAAYKATLLGISRRTYLAICIKSSFEKDTINGNITTDMLVKKRVYLDQNLSKFNEIKTQNGMYKLEEESHTQQDETQEPYGNK